MSARHTADGPKSDHRSFPLPGSRPQYGPDRRVDVLHVDLDLRPDLEACRLEGVSTTRVQAIVEGVEAMELDAVDLEIASVRDSTGNALAFSLRGEKLRIRFARVLALGETYEFSIAYVTEHPRRGLYFIKPNPAYPDKPLQAWTQSQDTDARFWHPCVDYPAERFTFSTSIVVPKGLFAYSNGRLVSRTDVGDSTVFRYELDTPLSSYLTTMVVGEFVEHHDRYGDIPVSWYAEPRHVRSE